MSLRIPQAAQISIYANCTWIKPVNITFTGLTWDIYKKERALTSHKSREQDKKMIKKLLTSVILLAASNIGFGATFPYTVANPSPTSDYSEFLNHCEKNGNQLSNCGYYLVNPAFNTPIGSPFYNILVPQDPTPVAQTPIPAAIYLFGSAFVAIVFRKKRLS
ncbi:MAG: hypothetical protein HOO93_02755 [Methyloglobulus sp.]|nr:hypothetical protein [Methyloglobulus sp.]